MARPKQPQSQKPDTQPKAEPKDSALASVAVLPEKLNISYPNFSAQLPNDWFKPSSSSVPRVTDLDLETESLIAHEQGNALELQGLCLDNAALTARNAVKAANVGKLLAEYLVGLEQIRTVGVKLRNAQAVTANEETKVLITQERGNQLTTQLAGERIKTSTETAKVTLLQLDLNGYTQLKPVRETEWANKIIAAQEKARLVLGAAPNTPNTLAS